MDISPAADTHMWERHSIDSNRLIEVIRGNYIVIRNRALRAATHLLIDEETHRGAASQRRSYRPTIHESGAR